MLGLQAHFLQRNSKIGLLFDRFHIFCYTQVNRFMEFANGGIAMHDLAQFNPVLHTCVTASPHAVKRRAAHRPKRQVQSYEMDFITENEQGAIFINGQKHDLEPRQIILRRPGDIVSSIAGYAACGIYFSATAADVTARLSFLDALPHQFEIGEGWDNCLSLALSLHQLQFKQDALGLLQIKQTLIRLIESVYARYLEWQNSKHQEEAAPAERCMAALKRYILEHPEADLSLDALSKRSGYSPSHLRNLFHQCMGMSPNAWITYVRMERAKHLLATENHTLPVVASLCGLKNVAHFYEAFKRHTGVTPGVYRVRYHTD